VIWGTGAYTIYSYLAPYLTDVVGIEGSHIGLVLFIWGCAAVTGLFSGGAINDRLGARAMIIPALALLALALASFSFVPSLAAGKIQLACVVVAIVSVGRRRLGILSRAAGAPDRNRRRESGADCSVAQCIVHVSGIFARRGARVAHAGLCLGLQPGLGRRALWNRGARHRAGIDKAGPRDGIACADRG